MKFLHLADLHFGKRLNEFSLIDDQKYIVEKILDIADAEKPDAVIIAGDVYDKSVPSAEAVQLFDDFLVRLVQRKLKVFIISGNHDSAERISFLSRILDDSGIYLSDVYDGKIKKAELCDGYGKVTVHLLPFIKPANVRPFFPEAEIASYTDAVRTALSVSEPDPAERNILVTHQFVTGASRSDSEEISVGGSDNVDASVFGIFDYVALGHIHGPQSIGLETVRYSGTPLKYSFSEKDHEKSVTVVEMREKGDTEIRTVPLVPLHDMREVRGTYDEIMLKKNYEGTDTDDYVHVILTDEEDVPDALIRIRSVYKNVMKLDYDNTRTRSGMFAAMSGEVENKSETELFSELYVKLNGKEMSDVQAEYVGKIFEEIKEKSI